MKTILIRIGTIIAAIIGSIIVPLFTSLAFGVLIPVEQEIKTDTLGNYGTQYINYVPSVTSTIAGNIDGTLTSLTVHFSISDNGHGVSNQRGLVTIQTLGGGDTCDEGYYFVYPETAEFGVAKDWTFDLSGENCVMTNGNRYYFTTGAESGGYNANINIYGSQSDVWEFGENSNLTYPNSDVYFITDVDLDYAPDNYIEITYPTAGTPVKGNFENWGISTIAATSTTATSTDGYVAAIYWGITEDLVYQDLDDSIENIYTEESEHELEHHTYYGLGTWCAHARLYYQPNRITYPNDLYQVATSTNVCFVVDDTGYGKTAYDDFMTFEGSQSSSTNPFYIDCSGVGDGGLFSSSTIERIACYAQKVVWATAGFLVVPQDWSQNLINAEFAKLKTKFPLSLIFTITDTAKYAAEEASENTSTSTTSFVFRGKSIPVLTDVWEGHYEIRDTIFDGINMLLYAVTGFLLLKLII